MKSLFSNDDLFVFYYKRLGIRNSDNSKFKNNFFWNQKSFFNDYHFDVILLIIDFVLGVFITVNSKVDVLLSIDYRIEVTLMRSSRKAILKITIFAIHSPFLLSSFLRGKRKGGKNDQVMPFCSNLWRISILK